MTYSAVLELFTAIEQGRLDSDKFHNTCAHFMTCLESLDKSKVDWFVDVEHVYVESEDEASLFQWASSLCEIGVKSGLRKPMFPWAIRGILLDGSLGIKPTKRGLTTSSTLGVFAELRTSLGSFHGLGVKVGYVPETTGAQSRIFSNVLWTGHADLPYALFTDVRPADPGAMNQERLQALANMAVAAARYSKATSRSYVTAIARVLLNSRSLDLEATVATLAAARIVEGIEFAALLLIDRVYVKESWNPAIADALVSFPRLSGLCLRLQDMHAFPIGLVRKEAIGRYLKQIQVGRHASSHIDGGKSTGKRKNRNS